MELTFPTKLRHSTSLSIEVLKYPPFYSSNKSIFSRIRNVVSLSHKSIHKAFHIWYKKSHYINMAFIIICQDSCVFAHRESLLEVF